MALVVGVGVAAGVAGVAWLSGLFSSIETRLTWASTCYGDAPEFAPDLKSLLDGGALAKLDGAGVERVLLAVLHTVGSGYRVFVLEKLALILAAGALDNLDSAGVERVLTGG